MDVDLANLIPQIWPIAEVDKIHHYDAGSNNQTWRIDTAACSYILRVYRAQVFFDHVRYEHTLLAALNEAHLPFLIPIPLETLAGPTYTSHIIGTNFHYLALFPLLPGFSPRVVNLGDLQAIGTALGLLNQALIPLACLPGKPILAPAVDLVSPSSVLQVLNEVPLDPLHQETLLRLLTDIYTSMTTLYIRLPMQIIHRDFDLSNILMAGNQVTAILDFEFASIDLRIIDVAMGLYSCTHIISNPALSEREVNAFICGYMAAASLTSLEIYSLPMALLLGRLSAFVHRLHSYRHGQTTISALIRRLDEIVLLEHWLEVFSEKFVAALNRDLESWGGQRGSTGSIDEYW